MNILREYVLVAKLVILSPSEAMKKIQAAGHKFLPLSFVTVPLPWLLVSYFGEGFKTTSSAIIDWLLFVLIAHGLLMLIKKKDSFLGLLSCLGVANFPLMFFATGIALMASLPIFKMLEQATPQLKDEFMKQNITSLQFLIPMTLFAFGIVYCVYLSYKAVKEPRNLHPMVAVGVLVISKAGSARLFKYVEQGLFLKFSGFLVIFLLIAYVADVIYTKNR